MKKSAFGFKAPKHSPGFLLWQTMTSWQRKIKAALSSFTISHSQFVIMALIRFHEEKGENPNQIKIINLSKLDKMTVSNALKDLVKREFVARVENPEDTRAKNLSLTGKGNDLIKKAVLVVEGVDHGYFSALTAAEHETLIILLNKLS